MKGANFFFDEKKSKALNAKINFREINRRAVQWEHPVYGLLRLNEVRANANNDILKVPKRDREIFAISIMAMALQYNYEQDWWISTVETDASDGLVMTLNEIKPNSFMGMIREVEVVEHRNKDVAIYETILNKIKGTAYNPDTVLICLVLQAGLYNLQELSERLRETDSTFGHVFIVFAGAGISAINDNNDGLMHSFGLVQVLPRFVQITYDFRPIFDDFSEKFNRGQEIRGIEKDGIYYRTRNKKLSLKHS